MVVRELLDISEAREKYARGLAISLTDGQIDEQLLHRLRGALEPTARDNTGSPLLPEGRCQSADAFRCHRRVTPTDTLLTDLRTLLGNEQVELEFD